MSEELAVKMTTMNYDKDRPAAENPVKIEDLSLRDGHQSVSIWVMRGHVTRIVSTAKVQTTAATGQTRLIRPSLPRAISACTTLSM